jgi:uncharacterized protein YxjI
MYRLILFLIACVTAASAQITRLPDQFYIIERFLSLTPTFDVSTDVEPFAIARKRFFALSSTFDLEDPEEQPLATASSRFFSWGTVADVMDPTGNKIGWIEEEVIRFLPWAEYRVFNHENRLVAIAKMNFWGTDFDIYHPDDPETVYATMNRPFFRICRDYWTVDIKNYRIFEDSIIDARLLVILAIYQTDKDNRDRVRREIFDQLIQDQDYFEGRRFD